MAHIGSNSYYGDAGEYHYTPYTSAYDIVPILDSISYSDYDFRDSKLIEYEPTDHHGASDSFFTQSQFDYSAYNFSTEPKFLEYNPSPTSRSYSDYEYGESKFIEYDPIDHHGAYDPFQIPSQLNYCTNNFCEPKSIEYNPIPSSMSNSNYDYFESNCIDYEEIDHHSAYNPFLTRSQVNYCAYNISQPKLLEYNPSTPGATYFSQTQYHVSYSTVESDDTEFEEYDPTPYGGGYDIAQTYGKSLPHSDEICYPKGLNGKKDTGVVLAKPPDESKPTEGVEDEATAPKGKNDTVELLAKPPNGSEQNKSIEDGDEANGGLSDGDKGKFEKIMDTNQGEEKEGYICDDTYPWSGYDYGFGNRRREDNCYGYGHGKQVPRAPYGYGCEARDLCESIFGYWPCLYREDRVGYGCGQIADEDSMENPLKAAADYVFGGTYSNGEWRNESGNYGNASYGYGRHYQEQPLNVEVKYEESSMLQHFMIFEDSN